VNLIEKNFRYDIVDSVLDNDGNNLLDIVNRLRVISDLITDGADFMELVNFANRISNLISDISTAQVEERLFENEFESRLYEKIKDEDISFNESLRAGLYKDVIKSLFTLIKPGNEFLDNVMIFVEDEAVKMNRLSILGDIARKLE